jgi:hypothetical protein
MNKHKAEKILDLWRECKANADCYDESGVTQYIDFNLAKEIFIRELENGGYKCIGEGAYKLVFSKKSLDFVVKIYHTGSIDDREDKRFKLTKYCVKPYYKCKCICIQPKVKRNKKNKAYKYLEERLGKDYCELFDVHPDNVGWIDNKPVIFDFVACGG